MLRKGTIRKIGGHIHSDELDGILSKLPDGGNYLFVIVDERPNKNLPHITYLHSVVLRFISDNLPDHPSNIALYKFFEDMFSPVHTSRINGQEFSYCELKTENKSDVNDVIEKIIEYARTEWGIEVPLNEDLKDPELRELHSQAYLNQEVDWSNFISSHNKSKDERRNEEKKRI